MNNNSSEIKIKIENNKLLAALCGINNENLKLIQKRLDINIYQQGCYIVINTGLKKIQFCRKIIEEILESLSKTPYITQEEIEIIIQSSMTQDKPLSKNSKQKITTRKITIYPKTAKQNEYIKLLEASQILFVTGPAGTGKTHLAVSHAVQSLETGLIERIVLCRPALETGEKLGFLPGDMKEKVDPYLRPLYDSLYITLGQNRTNNLIENNIIEIAPLAFMRGRSFINSIVILDEAQNTTPSQMKMFLTRLGEASRMVISGDISQIDLPNNQISGLCQAINILQNIEGINFINFDNKDVIRHPIIGKIVQAYESTNKKG